MADWESRLLSKVIQTGSVEKAIAYGVEARHFQQPKNIELWNFLSDHVAKYRSSPSPEIVKEKFPEYKFDVVTDPLEFVQKEFITDVKRRESVKVTEELIQIIEEDDREQISIIDEIVLDKARNLSSIVPSLNSSKFSEMNHRIDIYKERKEAGIKPGIPYNIPELDDRTLGLHPHQFVAIVGWTGMGKSTLGMYLCLQHYLSGYTPMIVSLEMDEEEIYRTLDAMAVEIRRQALKAMSLSGADIKKWEKMAQRAESVDNDIIVLDIDSATPERIYAETSRWNPDLVMVDYIQLMTTPKHYKANWEKVDYCSRMLKAQARGLKIPVYGLSQTNADGADAGGALTTIGGSKAIGHHADVVLGLFQDDEDRAMKKMNVRIDKNRGGPKGEFGLYWDLDGSDIHPWKGKTDAYKK